jgi:hypothetical protein
MTVILMTHVNGYLKDFAVIGHVILALVRTCSLFYLTLIYLRLLDSGFKLCHDRKLPKFKFFFVKLFLFISPLHLSFDFRKCATFSLTLLAWELPSTKDSFLIVSNVQKHHSLRLVQNHVSAVLAESNVLWVAHLE